MGAFGERLQRERVMRSITLQEISNSTKISSRMLKALEDEDFAKLPGGIFNKGFVRAYCKYLGIDEEQAVADYMAALAEMEKKTLNAGLVNSDGTARLQPLDPENFSLRNTAILTAQNRPTTDPGKWLLPAAVALVLLLGVGGFIVKYLAAHTELVAAQSESAQKPQPAPQTVTTSASVPDTTSEKPATTPSSSAKDSQPAKSDVSQTTASRTSPETAVLAASDTPDDIANAFHLQIRANADSWVRITADGKLLMEGTLKASSEKSFGAAKELVVTLGNAGGVQMTYNGHPLPAFESDLKYKQLVFDANGIVNR